MKAQACKSSAAAKEARGASPPLEKFLASSTKNWLLIHDTGIENLAPFQTRFVLLSICFLLRACIIGFTGLFVSKPLHITMDGLF